MYEKYCPQKPFFENIHKTICKYLIKNFFQLVMYVIQVMSNAWKVLKHYEALGVVEIRLITLPGDRPTYPLMLQRYFTCLGLFLLKTICSVNIVEIG